MSLKSQKNIPKVPPKKNEKKMAKRTRLETCEYIEREALFCMGYRMRVDVFGLHLYLSQRMDSQPKVPTASPGVPYEYQLFPK